MYLTLLLCALLSFLDIAFLQIEGKALHQQKDYNLLFCDIHFFVEVWNRTHNISEVFL